jgi:hypothetical protein
LLPGEESRHFLQFSCFKIAVASCDSSFSIVPRFGLLEHRARISVWGISGMRGPIRGSVTLASLPFDLPRAASVSIHGFPWGLAPNCLEMVTQVLCKDFLAWVMMSHYVKYFTLSGPEKKFCFLGAAATFWFASCQYLIETPLKLHFKTMELSFPF